jgi:hypothetical protein
MRFATSLTVAARPAAIAAVTGSVVAGFQLLLALRAPWDWPSSPGQRKRTDDRAEVS